MEEINYFADLKCSQIICSSCFVCIFTTVKFPELKSKLHSNETIKYFIVSWLSE